MKRAAMIRLSIIAAALAPASASALAEPTNSATHEATTSDARSAHVQLASADHAPKGSPTNSPGPVSARKPAVRVTTCRCGDQIVDPSDDQSEQPQD